MSDFYTRDYDTISGVPKRDSLFLWTVFILLLIGFSMACWLGSFYIFGHPEKPESYKILKKLHKLDPPKRFEITQAPTGEFLDAKKLYERYNAYAPLQLQNENDELLRMYLTNYQNTKKLVPYIVGRFTILNAQALKATDLFPSGVVALTQATDFAQVLMEHVYTADPKNVPELINMLKPGLDVKLAKTLDLAAVIHIQRLTNGSLQFTAVPLLYGSYALKQSSGTFSLEPPINLSLEAGVPIVRGPALEAAMKTYAQYQQQNAPESSALEQPAAAPSSSAAPAAELVRVDANPAPEVSVPMRAQRGKGHASPAPGAAVAMASPAARPSLPQVARSTPTPARMTVAMNSTPRPRAVPPATVRPVTPESTPEPAPLSPSGVPLTPFLQSAPAPVIANTGASWRTYAPGQMPRGRVIDPSDAGSLAERGMSGDRLYLRGNFVVTASSENRAVLRPQGGVLSSVLKPGSAATRVLVEYPAGMQPPGEGAVFTRDESRPFMVKDVRRGADGIVNVYVREITNEQ